VLCAVPRIQTPFLCLPIVVSSRLIGYSHPCPRVGIQLGTRKISPPNTSTPCFALSTQCRKSRGCQPCGPKRLPGPERVDILFFSLPSSRWAGERYVAGAFSRAKGYFGVTVPVCPHVPFDVSGGGMLMIYVCRLK
jgi:hypothetical protein